MTSTKTEAERVALLTSLGLDPSAPALIADVQPSTPAKVGDDDAEAKAKRQATPASEVVFDASLLDGFDLLTKEGKKAATDWLFAYWKSPHKDTERHGLLWRRCTDFVSQVARQRASGGAAKASGVTTKVKATKAQRDLADLLAAAGVKPEDLAALLAAKA